MISGRPAPDFGENDSLRDREALLTAEADPGAGDHRRHYRRLRRR